METVHKFKMAWLQKRKHKNKKIRKNYIVAIWRWLRVNCNKFINSTPWKFVQCLLLPYLCMETAIILEIYLGLSLLQPFSWVLLCAYICLLVYWHWEDIMKTKLGIIIAILFTAILTFIVGRKSRLLGFVVAITGIVGLSNAVYRYRKVDNDHICIDANSERIAEEELTKSNFWLPAIICIITVTFILYLRQNYMFCALDKLATVAKLCTLGQRPCNHCLSRS